jgi:hypothetical protein
MAPRLDGYKSVNAMAEAFNSLCKAELVRNKGGDAALSLT